MGTGRNSPASRKHHGVKSGLSSRKRSAPGKMARLMLLGKELSKKQGKKVPVKKGK